MENNECPCGGVRGVCPYHPIAEQEPPTLRLDIPKEGRFLSKVVDNGACIHRELSADGEYILTYRDGVLIDKELSEPYLVPMNPPGLKAFAWREQADLTVFYVYVDLGWS